MAKKRKMTKEELEQDPLLQKYQQVREFYEEHKQLIYGGLAAVVIVVVAAVGYYFYEQRQENKAQQVMSTAEVAFMNGNYDEALSGSSDKLTLGFQQIATNYSGTDAGNLANYYSAVCEYKLGNPQEALNFMDKFEVPEGILGVGPISFHATLLREVGQLDQAAEMYQKAANWDENESTTPYNLLKAAQAYFDADDYDQARSVIQTILNDYSESQQVAEAEHLQGRLMTAQR